MQIAAYPRGREWHHVERHGILPVRKVTLELGRPQHKEPARTGYINLRHEFGVEHAWLGG